MNTHTQSNYEAKKVKVMLQKSEQNIKCNFCCLDPKVWIA